MRELKFRLHDKEGDIIGYETHEINNHGLIQIYHETIVGSFSKDVKKGLVRESYYLNHFFKCQFIGIKDKNGKEIYELDIIKCDDGNVQVVIFDKTTVEGCCTTGFVCKDEDGQWYFDNTDEVIGNVHQHPHLLK